MNTTSDWIRDKLFSLVPFTREAIDAWCAGYVQSLEDFAVWKDGQQFTAMGREVRALREDVALAQERAIRQLSREDSLK